MTLRRPEEDMEENEAHPKNHRAKWSEVRYPSAYEKSQSTLKQHATTSIPGFTTRNDGETSVLGGIYTRNTGLAYKKVPFFADLPVIGWFFKSRRENDDRTEILVFITPKITNKANLRCAQ